MSGGVDSSVSALLAKEMGYECIGCTMHLYENEDAGISKESTCCSLSDVEDARRVCERLSIPYYVFNFTDDFKEKVIDRFINAYNTGCTPNPCIDCNRFMKFNKLFDRAKALECDKVVTGHYARIEKCAGKYILRKAVDDRKDQSYVLYTMTQEQLSHTIFPVGGYEKTFVRKIAQKNGFKNSNKPDSQDICFVPDGKYAEMITRYTGKTSPVGNFVDRDGDVLGPHKGIIHYTIGQHKRLGIALGKPVYVTGIDPVKNTITLGDNEELFTNEAIVTDFNWISGEAPAEPIKCKGKTRYRQKEQSCTAYPLENGDVRIVFDEPLRAITPGQAAVLYQDDIVLGGGTIIKKQK